MIALLTDEFRKSAWTSQEVGYAYGLNKIVVPLKISVNPFGFMSRIQAVKFDIDKPEPGCEKIIAHIKTQESLKEKLSVAYNLA